MKKTVFIISFIFIMFFLVGCELATTEPVTTEPVTTEEQVTTTTTETTTTTVTTTTEVTTTTTETTTQTTAVDLEPVFAGVDDVTVYRRVTTVNLLDGITATDAEDGSLTAAITVAGTYDLNVVGDYEITLSVTDSAEHTVTATLFLHVVLSPEETILTANAEAVVLLPDAAGNYTLPSKGPLNTTVSVYWDTDRPDVVTSKGFVIPPGIGEDPVTVTLTARFIYGTYSYKPYFSYQVVVDPLDEVGGVTSSVTVPFEGTSTEYVTQNQEAVKLFFVDGGAVPYIDVDTYLQLIDGAIQYSIISITPQGEDALLVSYSVDFEDFDGTMVTETYTATIDFAANTFTVNNFGFFENYVAETTSDYGEGLNYVDADYIDGREVTIPLGYYGIDPIIYTEGEETYYLMPFQVTNLLFAGGIYYDVYYNGDQLWGIDTFLLTSSEEADLALLNEIRTSSYNALTAPLDVHWATYRFLGLAADYFYGLRYTFEVDTYLEILADAAKNMVTGSDTLLYETVFKSAYDFDDLHTSHVFTGFYEAPYDITLYQNDIGPGTLLFYQGYWAMQDLLTAKFGSYTDLPLSRVIDAEGKTAVICITGFTIDTPDIFKGALDALPATVENVVIDLSFNTGGNVGAVLRILGYMTEDPILYHSQNPADGSKVTYYIESDYTAYSYDWYIVTSSVTFSAANLMTSMAKELGIATILGKNSSGGASSIGAIFLPDGSCLMISTNNVISTRIGNAIDGYEYLSIEDGIQVDYTLSNVTSDSQIIAAIAAIQAASAGE